MTHIKIVLATEKDKKQLLTFFKPYKIKKILNNRVECYLSHNFTIVAKDKNKIVGVLQWYIKENPQNGLVEFDEVFVFEDYRSKKIGSSMVEFAIQSVKNFFKKLKINPRRIYLFVSENNKVARALYEKYNFKYVANVGYPFSDKEKELIYILKL